ncbi:MAG: DUF2007 domain-containing protein [Sphingomonadales bacterium]
MSLVEFARFTSAAEAAIVKGRLEAEGIDAAVFDNGMNLADSSGWLVPVRVMVLDDDLEVARAALPGI